MKNKVLIIFIFLSLFTSISFSQQKISINTDNKTSENYYGINTFYFVHQLFADAFFMNDLYKQLDYDEMVQILNSVLYKINTKNKVQVTIAQKKGPEAKLDFSIMEGTKDGTILILNTNFHSKSRKFTKKQDEQNSIVRWYMIKGDKLVYRKDLYSEELEKQKRSEAAYKIIDYYLFDDNKENDSKVKPLIDAILKNKEADIMDVLYAKLYLGEYYLLHNDLDNAEKSFLDFKDYFLEHKGNGIPENYSLILDMTKTELELMKRMQN